MVAQMADAISKLQAQGSGKKRAEDNGRRLDSLESQIQVQNNEAKEYTRTKCMEMDAKLRQELDHFSSKMIADLSIATQRLNDLEKFVEAQAAAMSKIVEGMTTRINAVEQTVMAAGSATQPAAANDVTQTESNLTARLNSLEIIVKAHGDAVSMQQV